MVNRLVVIGWLFLLGAELASGQEAEINSVSPKDTISLLDRIRLDPEMWERIKPKEFLDFDMSAPTLSGTPSQLPVIRDFSEYLQLDTAFRTTNLNQLPIGVIKLYGLDFRPDSLMPGAFNLHGSDVELLKMVYPGGMKFSAEDILRYMFWKSERAKRRNKKRANAWKLYNMN